MPSTLLSIHGQQLWPLTRKANAGLPTKVWTRAQPMCLLPGPREGRQTGLAVGNFTPNFFFFSNPTHSSDENLLSALHSIDWPLVPSV